MTTKENEKVDILPVDQEGEQDMLTIKCSQCIESGASSGSLLSFAHVRGGRYILTGVLECEIDSHKWHVSLRSGDQLLDAGTELPVSESKKLKSVGVGIKQDVQEAEEAHFYRLYKSSAVMCRRAMQLGLIDKGIKDGPTGSMLTKARDEGILSDEQAYRIGLAVADYGGKGAHNKEVLAESDARTAVVAAVKVLNDIYRKKKKPASK